MLHQWDAASRHFSQIDQGHPKQLDTDLYGGPLGQFLSTYLEKRLHSAMMGLRDGQNLS